MTPDNLYPNLSIEHISNPNRLYAIPLLGGLIKVIICIPLFIFTFFLAIGFLFLSLINSFVVLFTGSYWNTAYTFSLNFLRFQTKINFFFFGLTDRYPGFSFSAAGDFTFDIPKPTNPNRLLAIPLLGGFVRAILLIPYFVYVSILKNASGIAIAISSFVVLFKGRYPESTYELARDYTRISLASSCYLIGLSDSYPNFWISMNHKTIKIILITVSVLIVVGNFFSSVTSITNKNAQKANPVNYQKSVSPKY